MESNRIFTVQPGLNCLNMKSEPEPAPNSKLTADRIFVRSAYWFWADTWHEYPRTFDRGEMLGLVTGILDSYERGAATKIRPNLRDYF